LPTAGDMEARGADPDDWLPRLAKDFPIQARFGDAHVFESNELLVVVSGSSEASGGRPECLVGAVVRRPIPLETIPPYLFGGTGGNVGSGGMLTPELLHPRPQTEPPRPGEGHPPAWDRLKKLGDLDQQARTYTQWVRYCGRYPQWI